MLLQELPEHLLGGDELGEDQELQLRVVLLPLVVVEDVEQRLRSGVRTLGLAAAGEVEEQAHLALLVLEPRQADRQQVLPLLLGVLLAEVVLGRLLVDLGDVRGVQDLQTTLHGRGDGSGAAGDHPLHQQHQEAEVLAVLADGLVIAEADVLGDRLVELLLELVTVLPA